MRKRTYFFHVDRPMCCTPSPALQLTAGSFSPHQPACGGGWRRERLPRKRLPCRARAGSGASAPSMGHSTQIPPKPHEDSAFCIDCPDAAGRTSSQTPPKPSNGQVMPRNYSGGTSSQTPPKASVDARGHGQSTAGRRRKPRPSRATNSKLKKTSRILR